MANVVRDPREHPDAIIPDLKTNTVAPFTIDQVAFVYGSKWKQRYFTRLGDDYYPLPVQWDIGNKAWRPYHVADTGADWWTAYYPSDNLQRPTGPTCDGCHAVNYDIRAKKPAEWNVGCETCHGPGGAHVAQPSRTNTFNPSTADAIASTDTCVQCHSQGQPRSGLIEGKAYDWPVGYQVGLTVAGLLEVGAHTLGETSFTHYADGTAHKNRMQGNDFVQSLMYRRGVTCASCHDAHGTDYYAQLRKPSRPSVWTATHRTAPTARMSPASRAHAVIRRRARAASASHVTCRRLRRRSRTSTFGATRSGSSRHRKANGSRCRMPHRLPQGQDERLGVGAAEKLA